MNLGKLTGIRKGIPLLLHAFRHHRVVGRNVVSLANGVGCLEINKWKKFKNSK